jgi:hypothetical protein
MRAERFVGRTLSRLRTEAWARTVVRRKASLRLPIRSVPPAETLQTSLQRT